MISYVMVTIVTKYNKTIIDLLHISLLLLQYYIT